MTSPIWLTRTEDRLIIYDPATSRPNPNGTGFIRDPFPNNKIPVSRFSPLASAYVAMARNVIVPNQAAAPGTFAYINNNFLAADGTTKETTHKFSAKIDHQLTSNQRLSYLFNLATNLTQPGESGPVGLPVPFSGTKDGYDTSAHRVSWDMTRGTMVNRFSVGINTLTQQRVLGERRWRLAIKGHLSQGGYRLQQEHRPGELHRVRGLG